LIAELDSINLASFLYRFTIGRADSSADVERYRKDRAYHATRITYQAAKGLDFAARSYASLINTGNNLREAINWSRRSLALQPDDPQFRKTLARLYYKTGQYDDAVATLEEALNEARKNNTEPDGIAEDLALMKERKYVIR
jgi:predicted Zn-dependent protease